MTPKWVTKDRKNRLVELQGMYMGLCLKGHRFCPVEAHWEWTRTHAEWAVIPTPIGGWFAFQVAVPVVELASLGDKAVQQAIESWIADDRDEAAIERRRAAQTLNDGTFGQYGRRFDPVARDVWAQERPSFRIISMGMDGIHFRPVAVIHIPGTNIDLHVDVSRAILNKSQRRHARRHGKPEVTVEELCNQAVQAWWHR